MSPKGLISQALGLQAGYIVLQSKLHLLAKDEIDGKELITNGLLQSSIIILSFATEIVLKGLVKAKGLEVPKEHNLRRLYDCFKRSDKETMSQLFRTKIGNDLDEILKKHANTFRAFRYLDEGSLCNVNELESVLEFMIDQYNSLNSVYD